MKKDILYHKPTFCQFMSPVPFIEVDESEFQLSKFLRGNWFLFLFITIFAALSIFLTVTYEGSAREPPVIDILGISFNLQEISVAACLLIMFLGSLAVLWAAFAEPRDKPIFYYFIGMESFKRLLLVIPLFVLVTSLSLWILATYHGVLTVVFSIVSFCLGIVFFSSLLVLISRNTRIRRIVPSTMAYALAVFFISLIILLSVNIRSLPPIMTPVMFFVYAMGTAAVFYIIATLIFEMILPLFYHRI